MRYKFLFFVVIIYITSLGFTKYSIPIESECFNAVTLSNVELEMGKRELTGKNDGKHIRKYMSAVNLGYPKGYPYCASGLVYCMNNACDSLNTPYPFSKKSASANYHYDNARKIGKLDTSIIHQGDLIVWKNVKSYSGHIEIIYGQKNEHVVLTMGFNTSNGKRGSQREGNGNYYRERNINHPLSRMRLRGLIGFDYVNTVQTETETETETVVSFSREPPLFSTPSWSNDIKRYWFFNQSKSLNNYL
jgi:hypothetical protein